MSLKAKIEAVIYASEEPVTLVQLVGLLGVEGQAEIDRLEDRQGSLGLGAPGGDEDGLGEGSPQRTEGNNAEERGGGLAEGEDADAGPSASPLDDKQNEAEEQEQETAGPSASPLDDKQNEAEEQEQETAGSSASPLDDKQNVAEEQEQADAGSSASPLDDKQNGAEEQEQADAGPSPAALDGKQRGAEFPEAEGGGEAGMPAGSEKKAARDKERRLREFFRGVVEELVREYATGDRGIEVREVAGGFRMATKPEYHDAVRGFVRSLKPVLKLSLQALETLAVVAYKQPVTAPEVSEIRGVDSGGVLGSLLGRKLISTAGRKQVIGRPILYKTTKDFLLRFGLKDISELPSIEEFEKMAGDFVEQEEMQMPKGSDTSEERVTEENLLEEKDASEPQADGDSEDLDEVMPVDGRIPGLDPHYNKPGDDPSADEAAIQRSSDGD